MEDIFLEHLVQKKRTSADTIRDICIITGGVIISLGLLVMIFMLAMAFSTPDGGGSGARQIVFTVGLLLVAAVWYLIIYFLNSFKVEYEYIVTNNELDIDKVLAKKGRKHLITIDIHNAELMARIDDAENNSVYKNPPEGVKVLNYSAMTDTGFTYFIDCTVDETRTIVLFQPTQKMVEALWKRNPRAVKHG
ncbi:MAG: hypothetical protein IJH37_13470 [Clostridia bacterium]|nr:hypothetical protein [Clostridia bacterium]